MQGDKKLKTPAINASSVKTKIPDWGRFDLGANGLNDAFPSDAALGDEGFSTGLVLVEGIDVLGSLDKDNPAFAGAGLFSLVQRNPTSGPGSSGFANCL